MLNKRDLIVIAITVVAEAFWLFPVLHLSGFLLDQGGAPLPLYVVLVLIMVGATAMRLISSTKPNLRSPGVAQALLGMLSVYLAISSVSGDLLWGPRTIGGGYAGKALAGLIIGTMMAGLCWYRGVRIAIDTHPQARLLLTFRTGIVGLACTMLAEQVFKADFDATIMIIPFFAISLAGLAFARMASAATWPRTIGLAISVVIGGGLVIGSIGALFGGEGLRLLLAGWNRFLDAVSWVLTVLLVPVFEIIFDIIIWLFGETVPRSRADRVVTPRENPWWENIETGSVPPFVEFVIELLKYPLLLLAIYLLYRALLWAYKAHAARVVTIAEVDRESIRGNSNAASDLISLAFGLLPDWMIPTSAPVGLRYPKGKPGISEVYRLYFDMLAAARKRGYEFVPSATPRERRPELEQTIPEVPVREITDRFNAACYGNITTDQAVIAKLRSDLEAAA